MLADSHTHTHPGRTGALRLILGAVVVLVWLLATAAPASAHGDHDARPLLRGVEAGPYSVSLWQVYPEAGSAMTPHLIVMFDGLAPGPDTEVMVQLGSTAVVVIPSMTTPGAWETVAGVGTDDRVTVTVSSSEGSWTLPTIVIPPPLTSILPMRLLIAVSIFLATAVAWWAAGRTARAWRRPLTQPGMGLEN
jgi:hypothetical protein